MQAKLLEIRDRGTFIPAIALRQSYPFVEADRYLMARAGFGLEFEQQFEHVLLFQIISEVCHYDPHTWPNRTMKTAHLYVLEHFEEIDSGAVIDVEFILGETDHPKESEALHLPEDHIPAHLTSEKLVRAEEELRYSTNDFDGFVATAVEELQEVQRLQRFAATYPTPHDEDERNERVHNLLLSAKDNITAAFERWGS